jgi:ABC-type glutathione transport system ATPase component
VRSDPDLVDEAADEAAGTRPSRGADAAHRRRGDRRPAADAAANDDGERADPSELAVCMRGVTVSFGGTVALDEFDLEMPPGRILGLLGPNGSGKTTSVKVLATLLRPDRGLATVFGHDVVRESAAR